MKTCQILSKRVTWGRDNPLYKIDFVRRLPFAGRAVYDGIWINAAAAEFGAGAARSLKRKEPMA